MARKKPVAFVGDSKDRLRDFPLDAKREAGFQIDKIQSGDHNGAFRVFYVASRGDVVFILHCFQKKTQKTSQKDINLGKQRYKELP